MKSSQIIWDLPTRVFHWLLVLMVSGVLMTGFFAPDSWLDIHVWFGTGVMALISFRLIWGVLGSRYSRFSSFVFSVSETREHIFGVLKGQPSRYAGHNPLGALMIFALIGTLITLSVSGFIVLGGEEKQGPLAGMVPYIVGEGFEEIHEALAVFLLFLIGGHLGGVLVESLLSSENLVRSMITGYKTISHHEAVVRKSMSVIGVVGLIAVLVAFMMGIPKLSGAASNAFMPPSVENTLYARECGDCHHAFHPSLLPEKSWSDLMLSLDDHFGEDASLEDQKVSTIREFLLHNNAEVWDTKAANMFRHVNPQKPLQITQTKKWKHEHEDISDAVYGLPSVGGKTNCAACHSDTETGMFADKNIKLPETL